MTCIYTEGIFLSVFQARIENIEKKYKLQSFEPHKLSKEINCPVILLVENECKLEAVFQSTVARVIGFPPPSQSP